MQSNRVVFALAVALSLTACKTTSFKGGTAKREVKGSANQGPIIDPTPKPTPTPTTPSTPTPTPTPGPTPEIVPSTPGSLDPVLPPVTENPTQSKPDEPLFAECPDYPDRKLVAGLYRLPYNTPALPDFQTMTKIKDICIKQLDVSDRDFSAGFPGINDFIEWFGLDIKFRVNVPEDGTYRFTINSDDGSIMSIDDKVVINNDGLHQQKEASGSRDLSKGWHNFHVKYYQGPFYRIALQLYWTRPGKDKREYIPTSLFARPLK